MRLALPAVLIAAVSIGIAAAQTPSPAPAASPAGAPAATPSGSPPPWAAENEKYVASVMESIKGKEEAPGKEVFKNLKNLGDVPAARVLRTMQAFSRSLGVSCAKCHDTDHWDSEDKPEKQTTRDMMNMTRHINDDYIKPIKAIAEDKPVVGCFTCHRGQAKPGAELRPAAAASPAPAAH